MSGQRLASWRLALRAARRDARRARGRTALVVVMVGLPVLLSAAVSVLVATNDVDDADRVTSLMGDGSAVVLPRAYFEGAPYSPVEQIDEGYGFVPSGPEAQQRQLAQVRAVTGGPVETVRSSDRTLEVAGGGVSAEVVELDAFAPVLQSIVTVDEGRLPESDDEVLVSEGVVRAGLGLGSTLQLLDGASATVVGVGSYGTAAPTRADMTVVARPGALLTGLTSARFVVETAPVTAAEVRTLNDERFLVASRSLVGAPVATPSDGGDSEVQAVVVIAVTAILIEVVLLAGPAFAVGARRQRRDLALVAAAGGTAGDVRRMVLAQAVLLGLLSSLVGVVAGVGVARLAVVVAPRLTDVGFGPFDVPWLQLGAATALGVLAAFLAALTPAVQVARQDVATTLAGRAGTVRTRRGWPVLGVALVALGLVLCLGPGRGSGNEYVVVAGTFALVIGAIALTPAVLGAVGALGRRLPLALRLAVRDTARQRGRTAPAVAAVMAAVAGVTTVAIGASSSFAKDRETYTADFAPGTSVVGASPRNTDQADAAVRDVAPDAVVRPVVDLSSGRQPVEVRPSVCEGPCRAWLPGDAPSAMGDFGYSPGTGFGRVVVADADTLEAAGVDLTAEQAASLDAGTVLVTSPELLDHGTATLRRGFGKDFDDLPVPAEVVDLTTGSVPSGARTYAAYAVVPPGTAARLGIDRPARLALVTVDGGPLDAEQEESLDRALALVPGAYAQTERGYESSLNVVLVVLAAAAVVAVLVGTLTATGLAMSDARPDLATLAAVGAAPRTRRWFAVAQAVTLGLCGSVLGVLVGAGPGVAVASSLTTFDGPAVLDVPWLLLVGVAVGVPCLGAAAAGLTVRSRLPMTRRLAT